MNKHQLTTIKNILKDIIKIQIITMSILLTIIFIVCLLISFVNWEPVEMTFRTARFILTITFIAGIIMNSLIISDKLSKY